MCLGVGLCLQKTTARVHGDAIMEMNNKKKKREITWADDSRACSRRGTWLNKRQKS